MPTKRSVLLPPSLRLKRFSCMGHRIDVHHDVKPQVGEDSEDELAGTARPVDLECAIHPALVGTMRQSTELHEALHIMDLVGGLGLKHRQIHALEGLLQQFLATAVYEDVEE